jgi:RHS repeat-associated protein
MTPTALTYYLLRDHLGSPELITNTGGVPTVKLSFSAYGERRGSNWSGTPSGGEWNAIAFTTRDGFTEHEHLDNVGLVHMNGRVYDPRIGRFLSPDPFIDCSLGSQGVNRYGYVGNNPLARIDPSGFCASRVTTRSEDVCMEGWAISFTFFGSAGVRSRGFTSFGMGGSTFGGYLGAGAPSGGSGGGRGVGGVGGGVAPSSAQPAAEGAGEDPAIDQGDTKRQECLEECRARLEPAVQGAAGVAGGGVAGLVLGGPKAGIAGAVIGGVVGALSGADAPGAVTVPYAGAAGATADMIVGGSGGMSNPFSRGGWIASLLGTSASRTPTDARTQLTLGASAAAYVDGLAAARAAGFSYTGSNLGGITAAAVLLAGGAAWLTYTGADWAASAICEGVCGR